MADQNGKESSNPEMDAAADAAAKELEKLDPKAVIAVATWWRANYLKAGHKRLAHKLMNFVAKS